MRIIQNLDEMTETARGWIAGGTVGFIPTMGHLHKGHVTLVQAAHRECQISVVSIFGNPLQFPPGQDPAQNPLAKDFQLLDKERVDVVFVPRPEDIFPANFSVYVTPTGPLAQRLEAVRQPDSLREFATLTTKLFQLVRPDVAYFSWKNAQRVALIRQLVRDLNIDISLRILPIVREKDSLALSNRNALLSPAERQAALLLHRALLLEKTMIENGERNPTIIEKAAADLIATSPLLRLDYARMCDPMTLENVEVMSNPPTVAHPTSLPTLLLVIAAYVGTTHLVDNILWMSDGYWLT